jgi:hypothetical protein
VGLTGSHGDCGESKSPVDSAKGINFLHWRLAALIARFSEDSGDGRPGIGA